MLPTLCEVLYSHSSVWWGHMLHLSLQLILFHGCHSVAESDAYYTFRVSNSVITSRLHRQRLSAFSDGRMHSGRNNPPTSVPSATLLDTSILQ